MSTDHIILGVAVAVFAAALLYAIWPRKTASVALMQSYAAPLAPVVQAVEPDLGGAFQGMDSRAMNQGFAQLQRQIESNLAAGHMARLQAALAPKDPAAPAPPTA